MLSIPAVLCAAVVFWTTVRLVLTKGADVWPWLVACLGTASLILWRL